MINKIAGIWSKTLSKIKITETINNMMALKSNCRIPKRRTPTNIKRPNAKLFAFLIFINSIPPNKIESQYDYYFVIRVVNIAFLLII